MKWIVSIFALTLAFNLQALITNDLVADWQAGVGISASGGRISQWNDQHQLLNNDGISNHLTQSDPTRQPLTTVDARGFDGVMFPWTFGSGHPNTFLNIPGTLPGLNATNMTVYAVATGPVDQERGETLVWFNGLAAGWLSFFLYGAYPLFYPSGLRVGASGSLQPSIYPPINPAIFVGCGDTVQTTIRWNNVVQTNVSQPAIALNSGGTVAINSGAVSGGTEWGYCGIVYRILIYKKAHSTAQIDAQVAELAARYKVLTNYTKQAVCRGASTVEGVGSTNLQSWPFQLWQRYPEIAWHNQGIGGMLIGPSTNFVGQTMADLDDRFVDPLYDATLQQNWLLVFAGINDINSDGISGVTAYGRLTNYVAGRKAVHPWRVVVGTIQPTIQDQTRKLDYDNCIRTNAGGWDAYVDPGYNSPVESRLNNFSDTTYFDPDGLHLNNAGYSVIADHFGAIVNVPHRSTGNFGP